MAETTAVRRRSVDASAATAANPSAGSHAQKQISEGPQEQEGPLADALIEMAPEKLKQYLEKAQPALDFIGDVFNYLEPYGEAAVKLGFWSWRKLQPYHPEEFLPAFFGLVCAFFGGCYFTLIAAVEALNQSAWEDLKEDLGTLYHNYRRVVAASRADDQVDADNDGIADVLQIDRRQLATRKLKVALTSVQPKDVSNAVSDIAMTFFAVVATLKVRFAEAVTLGAAIGSFLSKFALRVLVPALRALVPREYHAWVEPLTVYFCKAVGVSVAWTVHRFIAAIHSAIRGGQMFTYGTLQYLQRRGIISGYREGDPLYGIVALGVAAIGFYWQLSHMFHLPFPMNVLLFPFTVAEYLLMWAVNSDLDSHAAVQGA